MDEFEKNLGQALGNRGQYDKQRSYDVRKEALKMYDDKLKRIRWMTWGCLAFEALLIIVFISAFEVATDTKSLIAFAALALASYESTVLMKLWYAQASARLKTAKEIAELQLQIADLSQKLEPREQQSPVDA